METVLLGNVQLSFLAFWMDEHSSWPVWLIVFGSNCPAGLVSDVVVPSVINVDESMGICGVVEAIRETRMLFQRVD